MQNFYSMVNIQAILFIYLLVGVYANKRKIINSKTRQSYIDFIIQIALPCMIFNSFNQDISIEQLKYASIILVVSFLICLFSMLLGKVLYRKYPFEKRSILQYGAIISNAGFAGLPLVAAAYGELALFYASVFVIPNRIFLWSAGISLFTEADRKTKIKSALLNPGMIAVGLGLIKMLLGIQLHPSVVSVIKNIGDCTGPLSMIIVGTILAEISIKNVFEKGVFNLTFIRLILIPVVVMVSMKLLQMDPTAIKVAVVLTAMPVGTTTALLAQKYGADYTFGSKCVFVSTVLSMITVPILTIFL
ncbi:AEC family transporter [Cellulosilyticum sp. I15G10I2]|uniref:AEC family transporter n=1 Tax=Cellulosilyticum sp. I15G10I2 TaxID=1892843 RepID=UPI00085C240E|nr:AEC family transporter [Cellulosilyticum sp. I15G10I2]